MVRKIKKIPAYLLIIPVLIFIHFFVWNLVLTSYSIKFEKLYNKHQLKGKSIEDVVALFGKPQKIEYQTDWKNDKDLNFVKAAMN